MRDVLHHDRLAGLGLRDEQRALAFADRCDEVDDAAGDVLVNLEVVAFEPELFLREQRGQVLEHDLVLVLLGGQAVDAVDLDQREVALAVLGHAHLALDHVAGVQVEAADLAGAEVDVVGRRHVARFDRAQEAEAVGQDLEHAVAEDLFAGLGALLHDREHQLLLAQAGDVVDLQRLAHLDELADMLGFEFGQVHGAGVGTRGQDRGLRLVQRTPVSAARRARPAGRGNQEYRRVASRLPTPAGWAPGASSPG